MKGLVKCPACRRRKKAVCWGYIEDIDNGEIHTRLTLNPKFQSPEHKGEEYTAILEKGKVLPRHRFLLKKGHRYLMFRPGVVELCQCYYTPKAWKKKLALRRKKYGKILDRIAIAFAPSDSEFIFRVFTDYVAEGKIDTANDVIFNRVRAHARFKESHVNNLMLEQAVVQRVTSKELLCALLVSTFPFRHRLPARERLYKYAMELHPNEDGLWDGLA
jgi:hypothetical protein